MYLVYCMETRGHNISYVCIENYNIEPYIQLSLLHLDPHLEIDSEHRLNTKVTTSYM
jgi:hypothetical protein